MMGVTRWRTKTKKQVVNQTAMASKASTGLL
jgi:hypothetical protein